MRILTFDIEDWFHLLGHTSTKSEKNWSDFESRIRLGMDNIFSILEESNMNASFFVVGWIANKYPNIIKEISDMGFEVGSHTYSHQLCYDLNRKQLSQDIEKSIKIIEDCTGTKVRMFRAPGFSITPSNKWVFDVLYDNGIKIDCSIFPTSRAHGGFAHDELNRPSKIYYNGVNIKEFPLNTIRFLGKQFVFSGGGYFRAMPYRLIKSFTKKSEYVMTYFHPRDFDFDQPMISDLSYLRKFKSYIGLKNCKNKLTRWLKEYKFTDLKSAEEKIDWDHIKTIVL